MPPRAALGLLLAAPLFSAQILTNFEGASTGRVEQVSPTHWRVAVKGETDQDGRNRQANSYSFRVEPVNPGTVYTFEIVDLPGEYNYQPNRGAITADTPPWVSDDGQNWRDADSVAYHPAEPKLSIQVRARSRRLHIAHVPPYTASNLRALRDWARRQAGFREEIIGRSVEGRPLLLWTLGDETQSTSPVIWLLVRQHAWESGSSWAGEGLVRAVLSNPALLRTFVWKIVPSNDPDGVARGGVRFNRHGFDLNRNWDTRDRQRMPEIAAVRSSIEQWLSRGRRIHLLVSLHNTETAEYLEGAGLGDRRMRALGNRFAAALDQLDTFAPSREFRQAPVQFDSGRATAVQGLWRDFSVPGFLIEQRIAVHPKLGRRPTTADRLRFGQGLAEAAAQALSRGNRAVAGSVPPNGPRRILH